MSPQTVIREALECLSEEDIKAELAESGITITRVHRMTKNDNALQMVIVYLKDIPDREIFDVTYFGVEKKRRGWRCMGFGHTYNYCRADWVCGHCAKSHQDRDCPDLKSKKKNPPVASAAVVSILQHLGTTQNIPSIHFYTALDKGPYHLHVQQIWVSAMPERPQTSPSPKFHKDTSYNNSTNPNKFRTDPNLNKRQLHLIHNPNNNFLMI